VSKKIRILVFPELLVFKPDSEVGATFTFVMKKISLKCLD
jgi:hypothetical protein